VTLFWDGKGADGSQLSTGMPFTSALSSSTPKWPGGVGPGGNG